MPKTIKTRSGLVLELPTPKEDAAIAAGIAADPDTYEVNAAEFRQLRPVGRPRAEVERPRLNMRVDPDVLEHLRASGKGWQTRVNALLKEAVGQGRL
ncbi:hypothetical protein AZ34_11985 [Hylemonella gracilis str. Niagara R]|uniref:BrnA antitoxin family protein n=1 Tax=Hylemonella gracilis str. Niagara R TaxID=1458275 RepID=A0A016XKG8_9BURK|nr:BrnA antitoxin family protein [Hylemonella gracilis]EYC51718.1 hypothetical protein AZ34_11985 [Hylemonella gracilis str. Niagara R]